MDLNKLAEKIYNANKEKGFYEDSESILEHLETYGNPHLEKIVRSFFLGQRLSLITSEISEALEADRKDRRTKEVWKDLNLKTISNEDFQQTFNLHIKDSFEDEIADTFIRLLDLCGAMKIDIDFHINAKLRYNSLRPKKHGKNY